MSTRKSILRPGSGARGFVLLPAIFVGILLASLGGAFLLFLLAQSRESLAATTGVQTFFVAHAGLSAAIAEVESGRDPDLDGLGNLDGTFAQGSFHATADETVLGQEWTIVSVGTLRSSTRRLEAVIRTNPTSDVLWGLFSDNTLEFSGRVFVDSYDSRSGTYASQQVNIDDQTGDLYARGFGAVGSNKGIKVGGMSNVMGNATPGPANNVRVGRDAHVEGSTAPASQPIELAVPTYSPPVPDLGAFDAGGVLDYTLGPGTYRYTTFLIGGDQIVRLQGDVTQPEITLYIDGNFETGGNSQLIVEPGTRVKIHHGSGSFNASGGGVVNLGQNPGDFLVYSSTDGHVENSGNSDFFGAIYAPISDLWLTGLSDTYGSIVGGWIHVTGDSEFHYDEALGSLAGSGAGGYSVKSFRKLGTAP